MIEYSGQAKNRRVNRQPQHVLAWLASVAVWVVLGVIAFAVLAAVLSFGAGRAMGAFSPILALIVLTGIGTFMRSLRRAQARALLAYLNQAVRLNLPLPPMLRAAELAERGRLRVRLRRLRQRLEEGDSLGDAIERAAPDVPRRVLATIGAAEHVGQVPRALQRLTLREMPRTAGASAASIQLKWYPLVMLTFVSLVVNVFAIFVAPKFNEIFQDYGMPLPPVTAALLEVWPYVGPPLTVVMLLVLLLYNARVLAQAVMPRWSVSGPAKPLIDRLIWSLPVAGRVVRDRGLADAFHVVADALEAGASPHRALDEASDVPGNVVLRRRLARWSQDLEAGASAGDAARAAGMPSMVCGMIGPGGPSSRTPEVFRFLARYYDGRFNRAAALLEGAAVPALSLVFGAIVGAVAVGVIGPLAHLAEVSMDKGFM